MSEQCCGECEYRSLVRNFDRHGNVEREFLGCVNPESGVCYQEVEPYRGRNCEFFARKPDERRAEARVADSC